jgi:biotin operon repressor
MEEKDRQVKGIWIPIDIWKDDNLNWSEKILFIEIDSFTSNKKDCFISNEYISKLLGVSETSANKILSSLIKKGYVIKTAFDGRRRFVKSALTININQPCEKVQGSIEFNDNILNIDTNIDNNKEDIDLSISKKNDSFNFKQELLKLGVSEDVATDWMKIRKKAANSERAFNRIKHEIELTGVPANDCITLCADKGWLGFEAEWFFKIKGKSMPAYDVNKEKDNANKILINGVEYK